jgi:hypothetical protein
MEVINMAEFMTKREIKERLRKMNVGFNPEIGRKSYLIEKYTEALKDDVKVKEIKEELKGDMEVKEEKEKGRKRKRTWKWSDVVEEEKDKVKSVNSEKKDENGKEDDKVGDKMNKSEESDERTESVDNDNNKEICKDTNCVSCDNDNNNDNIVNNESKSNHNETSP